MTFCGHPSGIPDGEYALLEWYCNERGCDCRRVLIHFVTKPPNVKTWASINYGWEDPEFYRRWKASEDAVGAFLDPLNPQSEHAPDFLQFFEELCLVDEAYVQRLRRHDEAFKRRTDGLSQDGRRSGETGKAPSSPMIALDPFARRGGFETRPYGH